MARWKATVAVVIFDEKMYNGTGVVGRWMRGIGTSMFLHTSAEVAKITRTGELLRGLRQDSFTRTGPRAVSASVGSTAPHTMYVLGGTAYQGQRYIYSRAGWAHKAEVDRIARHVGGGLGEAESSWFMTLPPPGRRLHLRVHGQKANNFLLAGYNATARRHPALRQMAPRVIRSR